MHAIYAHAALGNHVTSNGAVYAARDEKQTFSRAPDGHTARTFDILTEYERRAIFAHIDIDDMLGIVHIDRKRFNIVEQAPAYLRAYLHRI